MKIIISPAKKMVVDQDWLSHETMPVFLEEAEAIKKALQELSITELKKLYGANDQITQLNYERLAGMDLRKGLTPAVLAYEGLQYQYMSPRTFTEEGLAYVKEHLYILSGMYGCLRALDGIVPYRIEMQGKLAMGQYKNLYCYWGSQIYEMITKEDRTILNLASKEYSKVVEPFLTSEDIFVTCIFATLKEDKVIVKATEAKMARGEMVRYLAEIQGETLSDVKAFDRLGYHYIEERSTDEEYIFLKG